MADDAEPTEEVNSDSSEESENKDDREADPQVYSFSMTPSEIHSALFALYQYAKKSAAKMKKLQRKIVELEEDRSFHDDEIKKSVTTVLDHKERLKVQDEEIKTIIKECLNLREWIEEF